MLRAAKLTSLVLLALGVADLVCRCYLLGMINALTLALHDPAKTLFHLMQLPLATFVLLRDYPSRVIVSSIKSQKPLLLGLGGVLLTLAITLSIVDTVDGFRVRWPMPEDVNDWGVRARLRDLRVNFLNTSPQQDAPVDDAARLHNDYIEAVNCLGSPRTMSQASPRVYLAGVLSALGILFVVGLFWTLLVHAIARKPLSPAFLEALVVGIGVLSPWLLLRPYSEWHLHFGQMKPFETYGPLGIAIFFSLVLTVLVFVLRRRRRIGSLAALGLTGGMTVLTVVASVKGDWFSNIASVAARSKLLYATIFYVLVGCFILAVMAFQSGPLEEESVDVVD